MYSSSYSVQSLEKKPAKKSPAAPFTTSTLQQEASRKLGFSVGQTMSVAQKLYEAGKITYMRTDSTNLSNEAMSAAENKLLRHMVQNFQSLGHTPKNPKVLKRLTSHSTNLHAEPHSRWRKKSSTFI